MRDAEDAVEKVMAGLRGVEAAPGIERRVLNGVKGRMAGRRSVGFLGGWRWVGVSCVAMLLVGVGVSVRRMEKHDAVAANAGPPRDLAVQARQDQVGAVEEGVPQRLKPRYVEQRSGAAEAVPHRKADSSSVANYMGDVSSSEIAGVVASFPAPTLPLTEQERLLLRAAQRGDPPPVAVFEVSVLPSADADETAEFTEFFEQDRAVEPITPGESK